MARTDRALSPCAAAGLRNALRSSASWHALHSCWSWFARPGSRDVLTQETECSPQLASLTAGHICIRGDFAHPPVVGDVDERPASAPPITFAYQRVKRILLPLRAYKPASRDPRPQ